MKTKTLRLARLVRLTTPVCLTLPLLMAKAAQAQTYTLTTLVSFTGDNGAAPYGDVTLGSGGNLYGTTAFGGPTGDGNVFEIAAGTNTLSTLATFTGTANGAYPYAGLTLDPSGNLYGTTAIGGASGDGTIFEIAAGTDLLTTVATFTGTANGYFPQGSLTIDSNGNLYGTTAFGGASGFGTVFKIAAGTGTITTLATFTRANGADPTSDLTLDSSGNLYGTTAEGGASGDGTVFEIAAGTNTLTTLATFTGAANGAVPYAGLTLGTGGNLYGTTELGGANGDGTVFEIAAGTNALTTLATFTGAVNGADVYAGLSLDSSGDLYGATAAGGASGDGTIFEIPAGTDTIATLATLTGGDGADPDASLILGSNGDLYGTTAEGGTSGDGTVFELSPVGAAAAPEPAGVALALPALLPVIIRLRRAARSSGV